MRFPLLFVCFYLAAAVWAGGYQGCLERIWQFQAYEIDGLNEEADRIIGYSCAKWDAANKKCKVDWTPCKGKGGGRCSFDDFMFFLGKAPTRTGWSVIDPSTGKLDVDKTATNCYNIFKDQPGKSKAQIVPNPQPYKSVKNTWEYNVYISTIGDRVTDV